MIFEGVRRDSSTSWLYFGGEFLKDSLFTIAIPIDSQK